MSICRRKSKACAIRGIDNLYDCLFAIIHSVFCSSILTNWRSMGMSKAMPRMVASVDAGQRRRQRDPDCTKRQRRPALSRAARGHARPHHTMAAQRGVQRPSVVVGLAAEAQGG